MPDAVLRAIRSQPWAITADWLDALEKIALRLHEAPEVLAKAADGHAERYEASLAVMGSRLEGSRRATIRNGVAALPMFGPTFPRANIMTEYSGATSLDIAASDLRVAQQSDAVSKILLVVDTPGGAVSGTAEFAAMIAASPKPVYAHVTGLGASAGYWYCSQCAEIILDRAGLVGSIGVVMQVAAQEEPDQNGYRYHSITSSNAANKRPDFSTPEGRASVRAELDQIEEVFIRDVARGRKTTPKGVIENFGGGGLKAGKAALAAGMVDRLGTLEETLNRLARAPAGGSTGRSAETPVQEPEAAAQDVAAAEEEAATAQAPRSGASLSLARQSLELRQRRANT